MLKKILGIVLTFFSIVFFIAGIQLLFSRDIGSGIFGMIIGGILLAVAVKFLISKRQKPETASTTNEESETVNTSEHTRKDHESSNERITTLESVEEQESSDSTYETKLTIETLPGCPLHIYNLSPSSAQKITKQLNAGPLAMGLWHETLPIVATEDVRCVELDEYVASHKELYRKYKEDPRYAIFDSYPGVQWYPSDLNLDILFEYPSERANQIRESIKNLQLPWNVVSYYIEQAGRFLEHDSYQISHHRTEFEELFNRGIIVPIQEAPLEQILEKQVNMKELRQIIKELNPSVKAKTKKELIKQLLENVSESQIKNKIENVLKKKIFFVKPLEGISDDSLRWFLDYISTINSLIFGTLQDKIYNLVEMRNMIEENGKSHKFEVITHHGACKWCEEHAHTSFTWRALQKDLQKAPPYHLGCKCRIV